MQNGVFNTTYILIYRQPIIGSLWVDHLLSVGTGIACVVPRTFHKGIKGVGFVFNLNTIYGGFSPFFVSFNGRLHTVHCHFFG